MTELDYAYLADFAAVEAGRLTAVGASFTHMLVPSLPGPASFAVAGRVRAPEGTEGFDLRIVITAPAGAWELGMEGHIPAGTALPYDGKVGILFAARTNIAVTTTGVHEVAVYVDGAHARTLKFDVAVA